MQMSASIYIELTPIKKKRLLYTNMFLSKVNSENKLYETLTVKVTSKLLI